MRLRQRCVKGQAMVEYALLFAVAVAAITGMQIYTRRAIQAGVKSAADRLGPCSVANDMCDGIVDTDGEIAQQMGVRNETGDQKFQINMRGAVLQSQLGVSYETVPGENVVNRSESPGGSVTITKQQKSIGRGTLGGGRTSHTIMVGDDAPSP